MSDQWTGGAGRDMTGSVEDEIDLYPGTPLEIAVAVNAESGTKEDVDLAVGGPLARWAVITPERLTVGPGEEHWATVRFDVPLNAGVPAGPAAFTVDVSQHRNGNRAMDIIDPPQTWSAEGLAFVMPVEAHRLSLVPMRGKVRVDVTNDGNISIVLTLSVRTVIGHPKAVLEETSIAVAAGASNSTFLRLGGRGTYEVSSHSHDGSKAEAVGSSDVSTMSKAPKAPKPERDGFREAFSRESGPTRDPVAAHSGPAVTSTGRRKAPRLLVLAILALIIGNAAAFYSIRNEDEAGSTRVVAGGDPTGSVDGSSADGSGAVTATTTPAPTTTAVTAPPATRVMLTDDRGQPLPPPNPLVGEAPSATVAPLHRLFSVSTSDYVYTAAAADLAKATKAGFTDHGVLGFIVTKASSKTAPFRELVSKDGRHLFLADEKAHKAALTQGYTDVKTIGHVFIEPVGTGLPLMRASIGPLLSLTTVPVEQQRKIAAGWIDGGIVGFLLA